MKRTRLIDLSGKRFGNWLVISRAENATTNRLVRRNCVCDCGKKAVVYGQNLKRYLTGKGSSNCGCLRKEMLAKSKPGIKHGKVFTPEYRLWSAALERARKKGLDFDILLEDIVIPSYCPLLNIPLKKGVGRKNKGSPSLDRIDSSRGYTKDNIWLISVRANTIKSDATLEELVLIVNNLREVVER